MIQVHVTQEDIDNGVPGNKEACPIALALNRATGQNEWAVTTRADTWKSRWARRFDNGLHVEPFDFEITEEKAADVADVWDSITMAR